MYRLKLGLNRDIFIRASSTCSLVNVEILTCTRFLNCLAMHGKSCRRIPAQADGARDCRLRLTLRAGFRKANVDTNRTIHNLKDFSSKERVTARISGDDPEHLLG